MLREADLAAASPFPVRLPTARSNAVYSRRFDTRGDSGACVRRSFFLAPRREERARVVRISNSAMLPEEPEIEIHGRRATIRHDGVLPPRPEGTRATS